LGLKKLLPLFESEEVDLRSLVELSESDLKEMGVNSSTDRKSILQAINRLKNEK